MKTNIKSLLAILALIIMASFVESLFLKNIELNNKAYDALTRATIAQSKAHCVTVRTTGEKVALDKINIPLFPGAERLTFDNSDAVRYRLPAEASEVAKFYSAKLTARCWNKVDQLASAKNLEKLTISLAENPISKKTEVTYTFLPREDIKVLGIQLAQETSSPPPPSGNTAPIQPDGSTLPPPPPPTDSSGQTAPLTGDNLTNPPSQPQPSQPNDSGANTGTQTCRVNGVDMPGSCQNYNTMPSNSGPSMEFSRPSGTEMNGTQGPSEEEMQKMDERRFQDMKRGLSQFARGAKMMKKSVSRMKTVINKCGVSVPAELENALNISDNLVGKIQAAQNADELEEIVGDVEDVGAVMQEWGPRLGDLHRLCQMLKQADKDIKQLERSVKRAEANDKANKKIDLTEIIAAYKNDINNLKEILSQAKELAKTDPEAALEKLEDDFYSQMDNVRNNQAAIDMALNASRGIRDAGREIKNYERQISSLKRKKVDTAETEELLGSLKNKIEEIKNMIKGKFDAEDLVDAVEETFDTREKLQDALQEIGGGPQMIPQIKEDKRYNTNINLPDAYKKQNADENEENSESGAKIENKIAPIQ